MVAGDNGLYIAGHRSGPRTGPSSMRSTIYRLDVDTFEMAQASALEDYGYELMPGQDQCLALSTDNGGSRLFVSGAHPLEYQRSSPGGSRGPDESLLILDATSLAVLSAYGRDELCRGVCSILHHGSGYCFDPARRFPVHLSSVAVAGDELFVVDGNSGGICVFESRTLEPLRVVLPGLSAGLRSFNQPIALAIHRDRMYFTENTDEDSGFDDDYDCPEDVAYRRWVSGKRVVVLSLSGEFVREYVSPNAWPHCHRVPGVECQTLKLWRDGDLPRNQPFWTSLCIFGDQLILGNCRAKNQSLSVLTALQGI